jgi:hypothetical protein
VSHVGVDDTNFTETLYSSTAVQASQPGYVLNICMVAGLRGETKDNANVSTTSHVTMRTINSLVTTMRRCRVQGDF